MLADITFFEHLSQKNPKKAGPSRNPASPADVFVKNIDVSLYDLAVMSRNQRLCEVVKFMKREGEMYEQVNNFYKGKNLTSINELLASLYHGLGVTPYQQKKPQATQRPVPAQQKAAPAPKPVAQPGRPLLDIPKNITKADLEKLIRTLKYELGQKDNSVEDHSWVAENLKIAQARLQKGAYAR